MATKAITDRFYLGSRDGLGSVQHYGKLAGGQVHFATVDECVEATAEFRAAVQRDLADAGADPVEFVVVRETHRVAKDIDQ